MKKQHRTTSIEKDWKQRQNSTIIPAQTCERPDGPDQGVCIGKGFYPSGAKKLKVIPAQAGIQEIKSDADNRLAEIISRTADINDLCAECETEMRKVTVKYALRIEARAVLLASAITALMQTMKHKKKILFDGTDVVNLQHGSLIHNVGDHVSIPKTALEACKENKFTDVIKIVESLDRDKIEKWPDAKLTLIGAERKKKEEFKYNLRIASNAKVPT